MPEGWKSHAKSKRVAIGYVDSLEPAGLANVRNFGKWSHWSFLKGAFMGGNRLYMVYCKILARVVSNSNAIRAHSHSHPWVDLERRESICECELNEIVLTNPMNPHSAQWIGIHNVAHSKINSNVNSKLNWVECASVDSILNWAHLCPIVTPFIDGPFLWDVCGFLDIGYQ